LALAPRLRGIIRRQADITTPTAWQAIGDTASPGAVFGCSNTPGSERQVWHWHATGHAWAILQAARRPVSSGFCRTTFSK